MVQTALVDECELEPTALSMNLDLARRRHRRMTEEEALAYLEAQMEAAKRLGFPIGKSAILSTRPFVEGLARICRSVSVPVLAIGGVTVDRLPGIAAAGAAGIAAIGLFANAHRSLADVVVDVRAAWRAKGGV